ncbi:MAG: ATP phosphoribosyltransferase regulatory subunit [Pseudonocardiaceae bacterium]
MADSRRHLDLPRGFHGSDPTRMATYRAMQEEWFDTCALAGYQPVHVPPVGFADTFTTGHHAAGQKLYRFSDRRGRDLALVSDSLPALLRLAHARDLPEQRLSYCCPIFRYERRPRRHFHHLGLIEVHRHAATLPAQRRATTRLIQIIVDFLAPRRLPVAFTVTDPGLWHTLLARSPSPHRATRLLNSLRRLSPSQRPAYLHEHGAPSALVDLAELLATDSGLSNALEGCHAARALPPTAGERIAGCHEIARALRQRDVEAAVDLGELHASEFHDGPSFLLRLQGQQRLLGDGGSYGLFASTFLDTPTAAHSAIIGLERLADLTHTDHAQATADVAVLAYPEPAYIAHADRLTTALRSAGLAAWDLVLTKPLRQHLRDVATLGIRYSILIGVREFNAAVYTVRDHTGVLHTVARDNLVEWLSHRRPPHR